MKCKLSVVADVHFDANAPDKEDEFNLFKNKQCHVKNIYSVFGATLSIYFQNCFFKETL
jgi:hypothetical protein